MTSEITVSYSEIQSARRCPMQHHLAWQWGWKKPQPPDSALGFGIAWHEVLNAYYDALRGKYEFENTPFTVGGIRKGGWHAAKEVIARQDESIQEKLRWMLEGYAAQYGREPGWLVMDTERNLIVPLPQLVDDLIVNIKVKIDLILRDNKGKHWVDDHKTCSQLPAKNKMSDPQLYLYAFALWQADGALPFGARYSYARKPSKTFVDWPLEKRFARKLVAFTKEEVMAVARDAYKTVYTRYREAELFGSRPPRNITPDCSWCDFREPCFASRKGYHVDRFLKDQGFTHWRDEIKTPKEIDNA